VDHAVHLVGPDGVVAAAQARPNERADVLAVAHEDAAVVEAEGIARAVEQGVGA